MRIWIVLVVAALACTPELKGVCTSSNDCKAGEQCSADGLCLRSGTLSDGGNPDSGSPDASNPDSGTPDSGSPDSGTPDSGTPDAGSPDSGTPDAGSPDSGTPDAGDGGGTALLTAPAEGAFVPHVFAVSATATSTDSAITGISFILNAAGTDAGLGQLDVSGATGTFTVSNVAFGGSAVLRAVAHRAPSADLTSPPVHVTVDQVAPTLSTTWDGGVWLPRDAGFTIVAAANDDRSGVASAQLIVDGGATYPGTLSPGTATFHVPASDLVAPGGIAARDFSFVIADQAGNAVPQPGTLLRVDDAPPVIGLNADSAWHGSAFDVAGLITDQGSGVAAAALQANGASMTGHTAGSGAWTFRVDPSAGPAFEGPVAVQVIASDLAGNAADAGGVLLFDTVPPAVALSVSTAADYIDGSGVHWFNPGTPGAITVQAAFDGGSGSPIDGNTPQVSWVDGGAAGAGAGSSWSFDVPRGIGTDLEGPRTVTISGRDQAGNRGSAAIAVQFDQQPPVMPASLASPTGWVKYRDALGNVGTINLAVAVFDNGTGVASATAETTPLARSGALWQGVVPLTFASANLEGVFQVEVNAVDQFGNSNGLGYNVLVDDVPPAILPDGSNPANAAWHGAGGNTLTFQPTAIISDNGSGVASASLTGATPATANGTLQSGNQWKFDAITLPNTNTIETNAYALSVTATDAVGNAKTTTLTFPLDNKPPVISDFKIDAAFDGVDAASKGWFRGPSAGGTGTIAVSALVSDAYLSSTSPPAAVVGASRTPGTFSSGRWVFALPRSIGLNASAAISVTIDAQDQAGNHGSSSALLLNFDDTPASAYAPAFGADATWYARSAGISLSIPATLPAVPKSGIASVKLTVTGQPDVSCTGSYTCVLPTTYAAAGSELPLTFTIVATSVTGVASSTSGTRNIDDAAPVIDNTAAVPYPAAAAPGTPLRWGRDGNSFNLRDNGTIYVFTAYDCGAGVLGASGTFTPQPNTRSVTATATASKHACAGGAQATIYNVTVAADLTSFPQASLSGVVTSLALGVTVTDDARNAASGSASHSAGSSKGVAVTRQFWQSGAVGAGALAVGPVLVTALATGVQSFNLATGVSNWTSTADPQLVNFDGLAVGGTVATPLVYYAWDDGASNSANLVTLDATTGGAVRSCPRSANIGGTNWTSRFATGRIAVATDGSGAMVVSAGADDAVNGVSAVNSAGVRSTNACATWFTTGGSGGIQSPLVIGRSGRTYVSAPGSTTLVERPLTGTAVTSSAAGICTSTDLAVADNGGSDAVICEGPEKNTFNGTSFSQSWTGAVGFASPLLVAPGIDRVLGLSGASTAGVALSNGSQGGFAAYPEMPWLIDGSASPVLYLSKADGTLEARRVSGSGVGALVHALPNLGPVSDLVMDKSGVLYVSSGGKISALFTDSPGLGTANNGWPIRGHDACRSYNLEFSCPY